MPNYTPESLNNEEEMLQELEAASWWWATQMRRSRLSAEQISTFQRALKSFMRDKYKNHWHEDQPQRGSAYRCITHDMYGLDPVLSKAAAVASIQDIKHRIPLDVTMWVDPTDVSVKYETTNRTLTVFKRRDTSPTCVAS